MPLQKDHLRAHRLGTRGEGDVPNSGVNSSPPPPKQLRLRPGGATRAAPPAPPPAHAPLPPSVPATAAYFHFRVSGEKTESNEEAVLEHPAPPLKVPWAATQVPL